MVGSGLHGHVCPASRREGSARCGVQGQEQPYEPARARPHSHRWENGRVQLGTEIALAVVGGVPGGGQLQTTTNGRRGAPVEHVRIVVSRGAADMFVIVEVRTRPLAAWQASFCLLPQPVCQCPHTWRGRFETSTHSRLVAKGL